MDPYTVQSLLYSAHVRFDRFPGSTGLPAVRPIENGDGLSRMSINLTFVDSEVWQSISQEYLFKNLNVSTVAVQLTIKADPSSAVDVNVFFDDIYAAFISAPPSAPSPSPTSPFPSSYSLSRSPLPSSPPPYIGSGLATTTITAVVVGGVVGILLLGGLLIVCSYIHRRR